MKIRTNLKAGAQGLGDIIADVTRSTGLDQIAKKYEQVTGNSCGCDERRTKLNALIPLQESARGT